MSFHVSNMGLTLAVANAVRDVGKELFSGPAPHNLHHYTSATTVESIIQSRAFWATCIADQVDETEVTHAAGMVNREAEHLAGGKVPPFAVDVLRRLPFYMEERKQWVYIACFCDDQDSALHWKEYGDYCLTFPAPWTGTPGLKLLDTQADCWYQRVIYDEDVQQRATKRVLEAVVEAIRQHTGGQNVGPWAEAMVNNCAMNTAQLLLGIALGFKRKQFEQEKEWRIVCAPRLGSNSSAPTSIDDSFRVNVNHVPRRHVALQIQREQQWFQPLLIPPVPFLQYKPNPNRNDAGEIERINTLLRSHHRTDLLCL